MTADEAKEKAEHEAPLIKEAHDMLVKWELNDPEIRALWEKMNNWVYAGFDETYKAMGVGFDKIYYESTLILLVRRRWKKVLRRVFLSARKTTQYGLTSLTRA